MFHNHQSRPAHNPDLAAVVCVAANVLGSRFGSAIVTRSEAVGLVHALLCGARYAGLVRIDIGPVSSDSAQAWITYAAEMLALLRVLPEQELAPSVLDAFASLLEEWRPIAQGGGPFPMVE
jgi:hypothetical protein